MSTPDVLALQTLLETHLDRGSRSQHEYAAVLRRRQRRFEMGPRDEPPGVRTAFDDRSRATLSVLRTATGGPRLVGDCTCAVRDRPCGHLIVLARLLLGNLEEAHNTWLAPMVSALHEPTAEERLHLLDALLSPLTSARTGPVSNLHWVVVDTGRNLVPELRVRERLKSGQWGKSKAITHQRYQKALRDSPHAQDRQVARRFADEMRWGGSAALAFRAAEVLELLTGHPDVHLFEHPNPVRIATEEVVLRLREEGPDLVIEPTLGGVAFNHDQFSSDDAVVVPDVAGRRIVVARLDEGVAALVANLRQGPLKLPAELAPRVVQRLWEVAGEINLDLPEAYQPADVPADDRLRVSIVHEHESWVARLIVRPLDGGPEFPPGEGPARVNATLDGAWRTTVRRLADERQRARELVEALSLELAPPSWAEVLPIDALLSLATRLQTRPEVVVEWPQRKPTLVSPRAKLRVQVEKKRDWFGVEGTAEIDGVEVAIAHLLAARREKKQFLEIGTDRFVDLAQLFDDRLQRLSEATRVEHGKLTLSHAAAPDAPDLFEGVEELRATTDWDAFVQRAREIRTFEPVLPSGLEAQPRDYQLEGFRWLRRLAELGMGACLADDMGLGKTLQTIIMLVDRAVTGPALVVAPTSVAFNWERELRRFAPVLRPRMLREGHRANLVESAGPGDVVIATWGLMRTENALLTTRTWHTLVLDEAQVIKNWHTDTARAARRIAADWRVALTGTPIENHLGELFSILETVIPGLFGSWDSFQHRFASPIERHGDKQVQASLARMVSPFILRRTKAQVARELPERTEVRLDVELSKVERRLYEAARVTAVRAMENLADEVTGRIQVLAEITRLRQLACSAHLVDPAAPRESSKTKVLVEQLESLVEEDRATLVFSQFTRQLELVSEALTARGIAHLTLTGETPAKAREKLVDRFQNGEARVFLISLKAGGTGLNLTAADTVFLLDPWWNPAVEDQAADRAHRIGQKRQVTVVRLVARGTIEEKVIELHAAKRALVQGVLGDADLAGRLSTSDLVDLVRGEAPVDGADEESDDGDFEPALTGSLENWTHDKVMEVLKAAWARKLLPATRTAYENSLRVIFAASADRPAPLTALLTSAISDYAPYMEGMKNSTNQQRVTILKSAFKVLETTGHLTGQQRAALVERLGQLRV